MAKDDDDSPVGLPQQTFPPGEVIFNEGAIGDVAYVVHEGEVEIAHTGPKGRKVLGIIRRGGMFGEMALVDGKPRMASATAIKETTCMIIRRQMFLKKLESSDPFIKGMIRIFVRNIRSMANE